MIFYRFAHKTVVQLYTDNPLYGCNSHNGHPYFFLYDHLAGAILESQLHSLLGRIPNSILAVVYEVPDIECFKVESPQIYGDLSKGVFLLGEWVLDFLQDEVSLIAKFPSKHYGWAMCMNYIINPKHRFFSCVRIVDIISIYRKFN